MMTLSMPRVVSVIGEGRFMSKQSDLTEYSDGDAGISDTSSEGPGNDSPGDKLSRNENCLREQYHENGLTQAEIAGLINVSVSTVSNWMQKHGIDCRSFSERQTDGNLEPLTDEKWLREQYCQKEKSTYRIANELALSRSTVQKWLNEHGMEIRSMVRHLDHLSHRVGGGWELEIANRLRELGIDSEYESLEIE